MTKAFPILDPNENIKFVKHKRAPVQITETNESLVLVLRTARQVNKFLLEFCMFPHCLSTMGLKLVLMILAGLVWVDCYPTGPPIKDHPEICSSMKPNHGVEAQKAASPYKVTAGNTCYKPGLTIQGKNMPNCILRKIQSITGKKTAESAQKTSGTK